VKRGISLRTKRSRNPKKPSDPVPELRYVQTEHERKRKRAKRSNGSYAEAQVSTLESASAYLEASARASRARNGRCPSFKESFTALLEWGEAAGLIRPQKDFPLFDREPDAFGDEHQAWFEESRNRYFKATYPNQFGCAWFHDGTATPGEYITRLTLQNKFFGDDIELEALVCSGEKLRVLTSQPHIAGEAADAGEIRLWFLSMGFRRLESNGCVAWYHKEVNLLVADAHEGNVIRSAGGLLPIDVNLIHPEGEMLELVLIELDGTAM
jgi:hypothetical protein